MPSNAYHFIEHWTIPDHAPTDVWAAVVDPRRVLVWWKDVYRKIEAIDDCLDARVGGRVRVEARGLLPYSLHFVLEATRLEHGRLIETTATGDLEGRWRATFKPLGRGTRVDIDWRVKANKPIVRLLSPLLRPLFAWNHRWTTRRGEIGLDAYLRGSCAALPDGRRPLLPAELHGSCTLGPR